MGRHVHLAVCMHTHVCVYTHIHTQLHMLQLVSLQPADFLQTVTATEALQKVWLFKGSETG